VKDMNEQLQYENARLMAENQQYFQILKENYRLRRLLGLQKRTKLNLVSASVIAKSLSPFFRVLRIRLDQGKDIVKPGMAVITYEGLVGQIERVFKDYSDVLLTVDRKSLVDVVVFRTGSQALLQGTGEDYRYACKIEYLERKEDVREGDEVFTSGLGQKFPSGILVGRITRIIQKNFGLYQEVEVTPSVDFSRIKEVFVVLSPFTSQKK
jgi:rod shape-determining protein MreC